MTQDIALSLIIPTFNRGQKIAPLVDHILRQSLDKNLYEVIFVNDGSRDRTAEILKEMQVYAFDCGLKNFKVINQDNQGQAVARHQGVEISQGRIILFIDDDMEFASVDFLAEQLKIHDSESKIVLLGTILPPKNNPPRPAFEYFYERSIATMYEAFEAGIVNPGGQHFFSGNVSMSRSIYFESGGFDPNFRHAEDRELGLRIQARTNAQFIFSRKVATYHNSDTASYRSFIKRARFYGGYDYRMSLIYPEKIDLSPFTYLMAQNVFKAVLIRIAEKSSFLAQILTGLAVIFAKIMNQIKLEKLASFCCSAIYILNYVDGLKSVFLEREFAQSLDDKGESSPEKSYFLAKKKYIKKRTRSHDNSFWKDITEDLREILAYEEKPFGLKNILWAVFGSDSYPILLTFRMRKLAKKYHIPLVNRILRLFQTSMYAIELGIDIELGHGVYFVHSVGTVIGGNAVVGRRCVLMGNNTIGAVKGPGSPVIGQGVVIGAGARILGSISVGERCIIGANAVVLESISPQKVAVGIPAKVVKDNQDSIEDRNQREKSA